MSSCVVPFVTIPVLLHVANLLLQCFTLSMYQLTVNGYYEQRLNTVYYLSPTSLLPACLSGRQEIWLACFESDRQENYPPTSLFFKGPPFIIVLRHSSRCTWEIKSTDGGKSHFPPAFFCFSSQSRDGNKTSERGINIMTSSITSPMKLRPQLSSCLRGETVASHSCWKVISYTHPDRKFCECFHEKKTNCLLTLFCGLVME